MSYPGCTLSHIFWAAALRANWSRCPIRTSRSIRWCSLRTGIAHGCVRSSCWCLRLRRNWTGLIGWWWWCSSRRRRHTVPARFALTRTLITRLAFHGTRTTGPQIDVISLETGVIDWRYASTADTADMTGAAKPNWLRIISVRGPRHVRKLTAA
jgi:hypothetical protein